MTASREEREEEERGVDAIVRNQDRRTKTNKVALHFCAFVVRHIPQSAARKSDAVCTSIVFL